MFSTLDEKNQLHVSNLIRRACGLNFLGTIEQAKQIKGTKEKIWEWRGGCPHFGKGRIRILYYSTGGNHYILCCFIKTDNDDYTQEIHVAERVLEEMDV
jgi:hypothetical protein